MLVSSGKVNQGLIDQDEFFERMAGKISQSRQMNDKMSFTKMSKNVSLKEESNKGK